ncbi:MAG: hypothetical protein FIA97_15385 [Methylococcaceae bacterium]|nr:hypothetical protein [Methylococcaceae bacterium]
MGLLPAFWLVAVLALPCDPVRAEPVVPPLQSRVTDTTGTLSASQRDELAALLRGQQAQIAVLIVATTLPETIEQFAIRVAESWKLGDRKRDDGILLLVALADHRIRIEVGYGLEGDLPDARAKRIVEDTIAPHFKRKDYYGGLRAGIETIAAALPHPGASH